MRRRALVLACASVAAVDVAAVDVAAVDTADAPARHAAWEAVAPVAARSPAAGADSAVEFRLSDQFGRTHDAAEYRGRPLVLVGAGRGGRAAGTEWVEALRGLQPVQPAVGAGVPVVAVADLRGVPRLLRRVVRSRFPADPRQAVLLDWDGALVRRLGVHADRCALVLVGPAGRPQRQWHIATGVDTVLARDILRQAAEIAPAAAVETAR